jgi:hypothetical protein
MRRVIISSNDLSRPFLANSSPLIFFNSVCVLSETNIVGFATVIIVVGGSVEGEN